MPKFVLQAKSENILPILWSNRIILRVNLTRKIHLFAEKYLTFTRRDALVEMEFAGVSPRQPDQFVHLYKLAASALD